MWTVTLLCRCYILYSGEVSGCKPEVIKSGTHLSSGLRSISPKINEKGTLKRQQHIFDSVLSKKLILEFCKTQRYRVNLTILVSFTTALP